MWCVGIKKNEDQEVMREHTSHLTRLLKIKPRLDINPPRPMIHLKSKSKLNSIKEDKFQAIQAENQLLLQKMLEINARPYSHKNLSESSSVKSLNFNSRTNLLTKITEENHQILNRLQSVKSNYSFKKYDEEFKYKQYLKQKLSENSRRIPRISSIRITPSFELSKTPVSRPETSSSRLIRPMTAAGNRNAASYLEL